MVSALDTDLDTLAVRADTILRLLQYAGVEAAIVPAKATVSAGGVELPSVALGVPQRFADRLRTGRPAVVGRIDQGRCLLDLRTVPADSDDELVSAVIACA